MIRIQRIQFSRPGPSGMAPAPLGPVGRVLAVAGAALMLVAGLFVSAVVFSVLLVVGVVAGGWFWWRTRALRRAWREQLDRMRAQAEAAASPAGAGQARPRAAGGDVIDGEDWIREAPAGQAGQAEPARSRADGRGPGQ